MSYIIGVYSSRNPENLMGITREMACAASNTCRNKQISINSNENVLTSIDGAFQKNFKIKGVNSAIVLYLIGDSIVEETALDNDFQNVDEIVTFIIKKYNRFAGLLIDPINKTTIVFTDRYGLNRINICKSGTEVYFSTQIKSLLKVLPHTREFDLRGLGEYLICNCVMQNRTVFNGINTLPPGCMLIFKNRRIVEKKLYLESQCWNENYSLQSEEFETQFIETFRSVVPKYFNEHKKVAVSLTGGIDTRMILAAMDLEPNTVDFYTFCSMYNDSYDVKIAREIARLCKQKHHAIRVGEEFLYNFPEYAEKTIFASGGCMDVTGAVELYANMKAREIAPVRITGNYGQEILNGAKAFRPCDVNTIPFNKTVHLYAKEAERTYAAEACGNNLMFVLFKQMPWFHYNRFSIEKSQLCVRSPFIDNAIVDLMFRAPKSVCCSREMHKRLIRKLMPSMANVPTDRGVDIAERGSMFSQLRAAYREFTFKMEYAYNYGMPQKLVPIDKRLKPLHLERFVLGKHKFYHFRIWYRDQLADYIRQILLSEKALNRDYVNKSEVKRIVENHCNGKENHTLSITQLLSLELIHNVLFENM